MPRSINQEDCKKEVPVYSELLAEYLLFLECHQGLAKATIIIRKAYVTSFLISLEVQRIPRDIGDVSASDIHDYVIRTAKVMSRASRKHLVSSLRSFLKFCHIRGHIERNLVDAVPVIAIPKLGRVPRRISWDSVQKLLSTPDRGTHAGRRAYAILQLLATYGVRIGQITKLRLQDIDWREGLIHFEASKRGKPLCFPLLQDVSDALLAYLRETRGKVPFAQVFLTVRGQPRPFSDNNHLNTALAPYYRRAGIDSSAHAIRHAFATRLIEQETPIKTIADLLGHKSIDTTFIYTKVDIKHLRLLAYEWPEVEI